MKLHDEILTNKIEKQLVSTSDVDAKTENNFNGIYYLLCFQIMTSHALLSNNKHILFQNLNQILKNITMQ